MVEAQQRATQAISGIATALTDITQELHNAQQQLQYWKIEADAWKVRYEQERARNDRLRRVLRCTPVNPAGSGLTARPSLTSTPRALRSSSSGCFSVAAGGAAAAGAAGWDVPHAPSSGRLLQQQQLLAAGGSTGAANSSGASSPSRQQQQHLKPLKCVPEGHSNSSSCSELSQLQQQQQQQQQQQATTAQLSHTSGSSTAGDGVAETGSAAVAAAGSSSPSDDPFAHYQASADSGHGKACGLMPHHHHHQQQQLLTNNNITTDADATQDSLTASPGAAAVTGAGAAAAATAVAAAPGPDASAAAREVTFRRSRTMPANGSMSAVQSPTFMGGLSAGELLHHAASWLPPLCQGGGGEKGSGRHTVDQLLRVMMAFTLMQGAPAEHGDQQASEGQEEVLPSVSLDDDDGSSGVGLAAAAAVSAAMARAWASAASREQRSVAAAAGSSGSGGGRPKGAGEAGGSSSGRAGFRLVATVTNKMGKRQASASALSSINSQDSLDSSTNDLPALAQAPPTSKPPGLPATKHTNGTSSSSLTRAGSGPSRQDAIAAADGSNAGPPGSSSPSRVPAGAAAKAAAGGGSSAAAGSGAAPTRNQATTISLQWLSRPRTVLVMRKLAASTEAAFLRALEWLRRHQVTIFVEPKVFQELVEAGRVAPLIDTHHKTPFDTVKTPQSPVGPVASQPGQQPAVSSFSNSKADGGTGVAHASSSGSLTGMLLSTAQQQQQQQQSALFPANSWTGHGSSGGSSGGSGAAQGAVVSSGGSFTGHMIKTWQQQQQLGEAGGSSGSSDSSDLIPDAVAQQLDLVVVLGGDGTVLWTCHIFGNRSVPPLVPFNLGSLGFLTPFDPARLEQVLLKTFRGGFPITLRHRLHATIVRCSSCADGGGAPVDAADGLPCVSRGCVGQCVYGEEHVSLNEVVIERGISPFLTNLECFCDGTFVTHVQGDGLIVGTPTGSTAYSLAAGGSMVHPQVPCILFTPICPHSLSFRPLMFPDYVQLCVQVPADARGHVWASFDGKDRTELGPGDAVVIRLSKWPVPSVAAEADPSSDWFSAVRECLHWNIRKVQAGAGM